MPYALITGLAAAVLGGPCNVVAVRPQTHDAVGPAAPILSLWEFSDGESNEAMHNSLAEVARREAESNGTDTSDPAAEARRLELCPWLKGPHSTTKLEPLCSNGNYSWTCLEGFPGENATRVQCPGEYPVMCNDKHFSGEEYACEKNETYCKDGIRKCEAEKTGQLDTDAHEKFVSDKDAATSTPSTSVGTDGNVEDGATTTAGPATEGKATTEADTTGQATSTETATEDKATTEAGPTELTSSTPAGTDDTKPNVEGEATTKAGPAEVTSSTGTGTEDETTTSSATLSTTEATASEVPDCAEIAPSTFPGGCDLNVSGFACYADKNVVTDMQNGRLELEVHWACSPDRDQKRFTNSSCRALNWTYDATTGGQKVAFHSTPGIYIGVCEFRTAEPKLTTAATEATTSPSMLNGNDDSNAPDQTIKATTSLPTLDGNDETNAPDQTTKATNSPSTPAGVNKDSPSNQTTWAPREEDTNSSSAGAVPNSTTNTTRSGSRPRVTGMYVPACLWFCATLGILRSVQ